MRRSGSRSALRPAAPMPLAMGLAVVALLAVLGVATPARAQALDLPGPPDPRAADRAIDRALLEAARKDSEVMANLTYLSDMIGPRLTGSAALKRANDWTAAKMKAYGLSDVHLEGYTIPVGWERGTATARIIEPDNGRSLTVAALGWTPGTAGKIQADVVVLNARNSKELAALKGKLKGAIVLRGAPAKVRPITEVATPAARPMPGDKPAEAPAKPMREGFEQGQQFRREVADFLRGEGAAAILQDAGKPHGLLTMTGGWRTGDRVSAADPVPTLYVAHEHYDLLHRLAMRAAPARTRVELEVTNKLIPGPIAVYNTVGEIRGSEKPDEFVVVGAHLDSWDLAQGATDNGTGSAVVLEAARILSRSGIKPKRTIRFVLFSGEEQGLHGSRAYVDKHKEELPRTSMCVVHDTGTGRVTGLGLQGREVLRALFEDELITLKQIGLNEITTRSMGGSDHGAFERAGVPGFMLRQDMTEYRLTHHSQTDTLDKVREPDLVQGAQVMAVTALRVANLPTLLSRDKPMTSRKPGGDGKPGPEKPPDQP